MATKSTALRNSQADSFVANLDGLELIDGSNNVIASGTIAGWDPASGGQVQPSSDITVTGNATAGGGTDAAEARLYDTGASGEEVTAITVTTTGGGGDLEINNLSISDGQDVTFAAADFTITEPTATA